MHHAILVSPQLRIKRQELLHVAIECNLTVILRFLIGLDMIVDLGGRRYHELVLINVLQLLVDLLELLIAKLTWLLTCQQFSQHLFAFKLDSSALLPSLLQIVSLSILQSRSLTLKSRFRKLQFFLLWVDVRSLLANRTAIVFVDHHLLLIFRKYRGMVAQGRLGFIVA